MADAELQKNEQVKHRRFFSPVDWAAFIISCGVAFVVYAATMAPTVTLEDSGELAVAGDYLGVPHPPGYPIWTMCSWIFTKIFSFMRFRGQPNPAWSITLFSVVCGALASGITSMLICRSGRDMLREARGHLHDMTETTAQTIALAGGVAASLLFAFSPVMWSQSVIVEVYSLNALFLAAVFLLTYRWMVAPTGRVLYLAAFIFGLGLTNYQVLLLAALPLVLVILLRDIRLFRDFLILGAPFAFVALMIKAERLPAIPHPLHAITFTYLALDLIAMALAFFLLPNGRTVALTFLMVQLGVSFYAYMPIVSDLRNPPMNWAYPRTWEGFIHAITRGQYERLEPTDVLSRTFVEQMASYLVDLRMQFTLLVAPLAILPFSIWSMKIRSNRVQMLHVAIILCLPAIAVAMAHKFFLGQSAVGAENLYKVLFLGAVILQGLGILAIFENQIRELILKLRGTAGASVTERATVGIALAGLGILAAAYMLFLLRHAFVVTEPLRGIGPGLTAEAARGRIVHAAVLVIMAFLPIAFAGLIAWLVHDRRFEFDMALGPTSQKWVIATLAGFAVMSLLLIVLANPKGDIQDQFIQRVKFISSHALFALWIGYGLIFAMAVADSLLGGRNTAAVALLAAVALPLVPIYENYYNRELVRVCGGAEQNNHDFGWQFGNYQLRGADAITEELADGEEEPLPNPCYPPEMGPDAVFFGGTDPGRFVPTYMIYSARVREDVYLITQNALADNTYMNVMRDLYGDQIWIPAQKDSAKAFQRYVEEVNAGKRPRNAQLKIENGRVQVSGALGVMEINGILAQMIFEHNNFRHDFYVEESYVISWMYPYLTPHGLIMKINRNMTPISSDNARSDLDFWDWYTRRLESDVKFRRDAVARKSFSKLRSAIAGLYRSHGMYRESELAFQEARILYPLSPEANFRLAQEVMIPLKRFADADWLISDFGRSDPGNSRVPEFLKQLRTLMEMYDKMDRMEAEVQDGRMDVTKALELAALYLQAGQTPKFAALAAGILDNKDLPPVFHFRLAQLYDRAQKNTEMVQALDLAINRLPQDAPAAILVEASRLYAKVRMLDRMIETMQEYLRRVPNDWRGWLDYASMLIGAKMNDKASKALDNAVRLGGDEAMNIIRSDERFAPLLNRGPGRGFDPFPLNGGSGPGASPFSRP